MFKLIKQLFCEHRYGCKGVWRCTFTYTERDKEKPVPIHFFECSKCGKRKLVKESDFFYNSNILTIAKLWLKGELEVDFSDSNKIQVKRYDEDY